jgi:hypothetical protein
MSMASKLQLLKFRAALRELSSTLPEGWRWEITLWNGDGERWKVNPAGAYQESDPATIPVEITEIKTVERKNGATDNTAT